MTVNFGNSPKGRVFGEWNTDHRYNGSAHLLLENQAPTGIDYVEESDGKITAFEFKWNPNAKVNIPSIFQNTYNAAVEVITSENFREFVGAFE